MRMGITKSQMSGDGVHDSAKNRGALDRDDVISRWIVGRWFDKTKKGFWSHVRTWFQGNHQEGYG